MILKLIGEKYGMNQVFVQCDCGGEILGIYQYEDEADDKNIIYTIFPFCETDKSDKFPPYTFPTKKEFSDFVQCLRNFVVKENEDDNMAIVPDKYLTYKDRMPGVFVACTSSDGELFLMKKFASPDHANKDKKPVWEIALKLEQARDLWEELDKWQ